MFDLEQNLFSFEVKKKKTTFQVIKRINEDFKSIGKAVKNATKLRFSGPFERKKNQTRNQIKSGLIYT